MNRVYKKIDQLIDEISMGPFGSDIKVEYFVGQGVPVLNGSNISGVKLEDGFGNYVTEERANGYRKAIAKRGDVVVTHRGTLGQIAYIPESSKFSRYVISQSQFRVKLKTEQVNPIYFAYYFHTNEGQKRLLSFKSHVGVPALAQATTNFRLLDFPLRPKVEQDKVVGVLEAIDKKIELNNCIIDELQSMVKTIYDYWFVQFDFPDGDGKPFKATGGKMVYNSSLKREIPEGWNDCALIDILERSGTGLNPRDNFKLGCGENYYVTIKNVRNGKITLDDKCDKIDDEALKIIDRRSQLKVGDVLFTSIEPVGVTYLIHEKPTNWNINESVFTLRPNYSKASSEYLYLLLSSCEMKAFTKNSSSGSIHKGIRHGVLKTFRLAYKDKKVIEDFSLLVRPMLAKVHALDKENQTLLSLRDWLLPMLMNGQVTVK